MFKPRHIQTLVIKFGCQGLNMPTFEHNRQHLNVQTSAFSKASVLKPGHRYWNADRPPRLAEVSLFQVAEALTNWYDYTFPLNCSILVDNAQLGEPFFRGNYLYGKKGHL